jgi:hypothetical protein
MLTLLTFGLVVETRAADGVTTYYVQLIRGTETNQPPVLGAKSVGPKLTETFRSVFRCKGFWEISRQEVALSQGQTARVQLGNGRVAEIDLRSPKEMKVAAFHDGKLVDRTIRPAGEAMTIIGGNRDGKSVWFVVVRRDKPSN